MERMSITKAKLYSTAQVRNDIFTENGTDDVRAGTCVSVRFLRHGNMAFKRNVCIFAVSLDGKTPYGVLSELDLVNFVL
jgi:hypothetical protein